MKYLFNMVKILASLQYNLKKLEKNLAHIFLNKSMQTILLAKKLV